MGRGLPLYDSVVSLDVRITMVWTVLQVSVQIKHFGAYSRIFTAPI